MPDISIAILTGGESSERDIALQSADNVHQLLASKYRVRVFDFPTGIPAFLSDRETIDLVIPIFHGIGGEDGTIQGFLKTLGMPFLFSDVAAHALAMNKAFTKDVASHAGIRTAPYAVFRKDRIDEILFKGPCVIKPLDGGSSIGVSIAKTEETFRAGITEASRTGDSVLIETFIAGEEYTVAVIDERGETIALPVIAIRPKTAFFDVASKYDPALADEICPAPIEDGLRDKLQAVAVAVHQLIGARHLTRSDFIVDGKGEVWFLEINTIPGQTKNSLVPKAIRASGRDMADVFAAWIDGMLKKD